MLMGSADAVAAAKKEVEGIIADPAAAMAAQRARVAAVRVWCACAGDWLVPSVSSGPWLDRVHGVVTAGGCGWCRTCGVVEHDKWWRHVRWWQCQRGDARGAVLGRVRTRDGFVQLARTCTRQPVSRSFMIGKGGENIHEIQDRTGATIQVQVRSCVWLCVCGCVAVPAVCTSEVTVTWAAERVRGGSWRNFAHRDHHGRTGSSSRGEAHDPGKAGRKVRRRQVGIALCLLRNLGLTVWRAALAEVATTALEVDLSSRCVCDCVGLCV